jgi:hypothetical protein
MLLGFLIIQQNLNSNQLPDYQYLLTSAPDIETHSAVMGIEKGRKILLTNIITGYQKTQRTALSPFRQMLSAFDRDCIEADEIFIIGYSYGDEHINDIIRNARKYNSKCKITLINPSFDDEKIMFDFLLHWESLHPYILVIPQTFVYLLVVRVGYNPYKNENTH